MPPRTLLIDADDTLWENGIYYQRCAAAFECFVASLGCTAAGVADTLRSCEQEVIPVHGYGPDGYCLALESACAQLLTESGHQMSVETRARARAIGDLVVHPPMVLLPEVRPTLEALRPTCRLVLVTKGDRATQRGKIERSGLGHLFESQFVVSEKDESAYRSIVGTLGLDPITTWMVGNSPRSDINPAVRAGLAAIHIPHGETWLAEIEEIERPERVATLERFADLIAYFGLETAHAVVEGGPKADAEF